MPSVWNISEEDWLEVMIVRNEADRGTWRRRYEASADEAGKRCLGKQSETAAARRQS